MSKNKKLKIPVRKNASNHRKLVKSIAETNQIVKSLKESE